MKKLKSYLPAILIIVIIAIIIIARSSGHNHFRYDLAKHSEPAVDGSNIVTPATLKNLQGNILLLNIATSRTDHEVYPGQVAVSPDSVLSVRIRKLINSNKGPVVIFSDNQGAAARVWMILSQAGYGNLYILSLSADNEILNEKIRSDSTAGPDPL